MYFQTPEFALVFLPAAACAFVLLECLAPRRLQLSFLILASLVFYASWNPRFVALLLASVALNYGGGLILAESAKARRKPIATAIVGADLLILGYFKYAGFLVVNADAALGIHLPIPAIVLPLGVSFFTFQQISYIVDVCRGAAPARDPITYTLFVTFFPHLIAGPILHHRGMIPQFERERGGQRRRQDIAIGLTLFLCGVFKKLVFADSVTGYASQIFDLPAGAAPPGWLDAWLAALSYTLQIYFDFSGYSDMAIGLARIFGITLPANFNSPYKAASMVEFWRRWHMTLSRFLRDYLYVPLGGNRRGRVRRYVNLLVTMLLGGLWHGAGWTFVAWGAWHGAMLCVNHAIDAIWPWRHPLKRTVGWIATMTAVVIGWVLFRAGSFATAARLLAAMADPHGPPRRYPIPDHQWSAMLASLGVPHAAEAWLALLFAIAWLLPNTQEWLARYHPVLAVPEMPPSETPLVSGFLTTPDFAAGLSRGIAFGLIALFYAWLTLGLGDRSEPFIYAFF